MKFTYKISALIAFLYISILSCKTIQAQYQRQNLFDFDWRFHKGGAQGAEDPSFDDSEWRKIDLPHDWGIEDITGKESPFDINAVSQVNGGFTTGGTGWYRKRFYMPSDQKEHFFRILFEGVYMNPDVWINGQYLGNHPYGYTSFWFDITDKIKFDAENVLCVKVKNEGENSRWYSGSGIYRHVWLQILPPVHFDPWGTSITTPFVTEKESSISVGNTLINKTEHETKAGIIVRIYTAGSHILAEQKEMEVLIPPDKNKEVTVNIVLKNPKLWSVDLPTLYEAESEIYVDGRLSDATTSRFGIRSVIFSLSDGCLVNGKPVKLKGGCLHHDNGPLGSMAYDRAEERRVEILKANGYNAVRCAHNPPSPAFLNACDRLGMLVIDEAFDMWNKQKNPHDYHLYFNDWWKKDLESMVIRDRNHPSVIMWSIGNEIPDRTKPEVILLAKMLAGYVKDLDPTRPVTSAVNDLKPDKDPYFATLDIAGYNYASGGDHNQESLYGKDHQRVPGRIMYGSESYPLEAFQSWMEVMNNTFVIGDFVWTAFDYIGEASIGWRGYWQKQNFFPWNLAYCGDIDICGWKRPQSFYRDALWKENQLSIWIKPPEPSFIENPDRQPWSKWHWFDVVDDWNWHGYEGHLFEVSVYSSCDSVALVLNGKSLGIKPTNTGTRLTASWMVPFQPGILRADGYKNGKRVAESELRSVDVASRIKLTADRDKISSDGQDLCYLTVELTDMDGYRNPGADNLVTFEITGPGKIIATGNANPESLESYQRPFRKAWHGRCLAVIKSETKGGTITVAATSPGLEPAMLTIKSE
jgi:beta-galactosidase